MGGVGESLKGKSAVHIISSRLRAGSRSRCVVVYGGAVFAEVQPNIEQ